MIKMIKELLKNDQTVQERMLLEEKTDKDLIKYINFKAKEHLNSVNGGIEDNIVSGWAIHYYIESKETIDKEMKIVKSIPKKELTPEEQKIKDKKEKELQDSKVKLANKKSKDRKIKLIQLEKEKEELNVSDPFKIHTIDFKNLVIVSTVPKKENKDQMGLFDI